jgi:hypothetical protein
VTTLSATPAADRSGPEAIHATARRCIRCLLAIGIAAAVGLTGAVWIHDTPYIAAYAILLVTGFGGAWAIVGYVSGEQDAAYLAGLHGAARERAFAEERAAATGALAEAVCATRQEAAEAIAQAHREHDEAERERVRIETEARRPCVIQVDTSDQRPGDGYLYVVEFSTGAIKVGQTINLKQRLAKHRRDAEAIDVAITDYWYSEPHRQYEVNEKTLLRYCARLGRKAKNEYFHGLGLGTASAYADRLASRESREAAK